MPKRTCAVPECERKSICRGWCHMHYTRWSKTGDPEKVKVRAFRAPAPRKCCIVDGCGRPHSSRGWCTMHYTRWYITGDPLTTKKLPSEQWQQVCTVDGCEATHKSRGYCNQHYRRWLKFGDPLITTYVRDPDRPCQVTGCDRKHVAKGYCAMHFRRVRATGDAGGVDPQWQYGPETCTAPGCDRPHSSNGYCASHRQVLIRAPRKRAVTDEIVRLEIVVERDAWTCGICKEPVDPDLRHPDPMSRSLDHIVPIARGGRHNYANIQLTHWICNIRKGDRITA